MFLTIIIAAIPNAVITPESRCRPRRPIMDAAESYTEGGSVCEWARCCLGVDIIDCQDGEIDFFEKIFYNSEFNLYIGRKV